ncbi:MAG TPA: hypothetical protein VMA53_28960 [Stellaceae bacterium]|nr:hypothetical protein [Stellaceae bacterium]
MSCLCERPGAASGSAGRGACRTAATLIAIALPLLLGGCNDAHPLYGPNAPRNGDGMPVDPIYGTQLPGTAKISD